MRRAVLLDQLSLSAPGSGFVEEATAILEAGGFGVVTVPGESTTVEAFQRLPSLAPDLLVLRVHSARIEDDAGLSDDVALFTGEVIDLAAYDLSGISDGAATAVAEELGRFGPGRDGNAARVRFTAAEMAALVPVTYSRRGVEMPYFGLRPEFVRDHLQGRLPAHGTVILMGCDGLRSPRLARAFTDRGAAAFVSWDAPVTAAHTDAATLLLLAELASDGRDVRGAVSRVTDAHGPDPVSGARLVVYP